MSRTGKKQDDNEKKYTAEDMRIEGNKIIEALNERGTWDDLKALRTELKEFPYAIYGKVWTIKYRDIGWGERNQITETLALKFGNNPNPTIYTRAVQEAVIKKRVVFIGDHKMQTDQGEPIAVEWHSLPQDLGEFLRRSFYNDTGEVCNRIVEGTGVNSIEELKEIIDNLVLKKNEGPDGIQTQEDALLKK